MVSEDKKRGKLTHRVHKKKCGAPQKQGLPGKKKGDRENLSPVCGGGRLATNQLSIHTQSCVVALERECEEELYRSMPCHGTARRRNRALSTFLAKYA